MTPLRGPERASTMKDKDERRAALWKEWRYEFEAWMPSVGVRRYDRSALNPEGTPEDPRNCVYEIPPSGARGWESWHSHQCAKRRGYGPKGLYCKIHARMLAQGLKEDPVACLNRGATNTRGSLSSYR